MNKLTAAQKTILASLIEATGFNPVSMLGGKVKDVDAANAELETELFIQLTIECCFLGGISMQDEVYENDATFKAFRTFYGMAIATEIFDIKIEELSDLDAEMFLQSQIEAELSAVEA